MPSEKAVLLRSIRRWLLLSTFLLGIGVVGIAKMGYFVTDFQNQQLWRIARVLSWSVTLAAGIRFIGTFT
ncbi:hypothetical protein HNR49_002266 [Halobacterium salinarum]|uniref:Uncharacterized protein n=1 Tax=Halobacterium salinarum TaxID=2242 RepID=A0A841HEV5_HALSI|nr:hypothetical protein [Halobacterium salinarum]